MRPLRVATPEEVCHYGKTLPKGLRAPIGGGAGYVLSGAVGAVNSGGPGAAVTPAYDVGAPRAGNDLLLCWVEGFGSATLPAAPVGWSVAVQKAGTSCSASLFYKVAAGGDAAPTIAAVTSTALAAALGEFFGNLTTTPLDQSGSAAGTTSTQVATAGGVDAAIGELVVYVSAQRYGANATATNSVALNNGATANDNENNSGVSLNHYVFGYGITTSNAAADAATLTFTTTSITGAAVAVASFKLAQTLPWSPRAMPFA